jgi:hypothetical protein
MREMHDVYKNGQARGCITTKLLGGEEGLYFKDLDIAYSCGQTIEGECVISCNGILSFC